MKFAHLADCHIGGWRDPKLSSLTTKAFKKAIDRCIEYKVDFILISGDLFNTSIPGIDKIKFTAQCLKKLKDLNIPVYLIAGSHDFSPSGKTMLDVLEESGLCTNVVKGEIIDNKLRLNFTIDEKTNAKITGMLGLRNMLEKNHYENLITQNLENEQGFKIFMFHTALTELKPKHMERMESSPISLLPKNFDYYAGGHVHIVEHKSLPGYNNVIYPGPLFPNSFSELKELGGGGFYIYDNGNIIREDIILHKVVDIDIDCNRNTPEQVERDLRENIEKHNIDDAIVLIRLVGTLESGKISNINFKEIFELLYQKNAYFVMKNTSALKTKEFEEIKIDTSAVEEIEDNLIREHLDQIKVTGMSIEKEEHLAKQLMLLLNRERDEGEKVSDFEDRMKDEVSKLLEIE